MHKFIKHYARNPLRAIVLHLLKKRPMSGIDIMNEIERLSLGTWRPSPGAIYPLLRAMEEEGLVTHVEEKGRKVYSLTPKGQSQASIAGLVFPPLDLPDIVDILESYVDYLYDYTSTNGPIPGDLAERLASVSRRLLKLVGEEA